MIARAMPTRRRMPPESSAGSLLMASSNSTKLSASRTRLSTSASGRCSSIRRKATLSRTFSESQSALLENDTYFAAQVKQFFFRHRRDVMPKHVNVAGIGLNQAQAELENRALAGAGDAQDHLGFTALEFKGDAVENRQIIKADGDI